MVNRRRLCPSHWSPLLRGSCPTLCHPEETCQWRVRREMRDFSSVRRLAVLSSSAFPACHRALPPGGKREICRTTKLHISYYATRWRDLRCSRSTGGTTNHATAGTLSIIPLPSRRNGFFLSSGRQSTRFAGNADIPCTACPPMYWRPLIDKQRRKCIKRFSPRCLYP
jgi:hypothetical protein